MITSCHQGVKCDHWEPREQNEEDWKFESRDRGQRGAADMQAMFNNASRFYTISEEGAYLSLRIFEE